MSRPFRPEWILLLAGVLIGLLGAETLPAATLTIQEAYRTALDQNERIKVARQELQSARQDVRAARSALLPQLSVEARSYRQKEISTFGAFTVPESETNYSGRLTQALYHGGQEFSALDISQYRRRMAELALYRRKQVVLFDVARSYFDVLLAQKNVDLARNALERARQQLRQARGRYEVGQTTRSTVLRAEVEVSRAKEQLRRSRNQVRLAREGLAVELGTRTVTQDLRDVTIEALADTPVSRYQEIATRKRRDLQREQYMVRAAAEQVDFEQADWYPEVDLVGEYQHYENEQFHGSEQDWRATVVASYPVFSGFLNDAQIKRARQEYQRVQYAYRRLQREVRRDVRRLYLDLQTQRSVLQTLKSQVQSARENYEEVAAQFREGLVDSVDVSDALTVLNESEIRLANARNTLQLDRLRLKLAIGVFQQSLLKEPQ